jgi:hypothetical protein
VRIVNHHDHHSQQMLSILFSDVNQNRHIQIVKISKSFD